MSYKNLILLITCIGISMLPVTIFADQYDSVSENISEISADPELIDNENETLNLSKSATLAAGCPAQSLFGQTFQVPTDTNWVASTSDNGAVGSILVFDNFVNSGSINKISFWGINGYYVGETWYVCYESPMEFQIRFFIDNNGVPDTEVASYNVSSIGNQTGLIYRGAFELYQYFVDLPEPVELTEGWISIQGLDGNPECWFEWMSSDDGYDGSSLQWDGSSLNLARTDRAFCLQHQEYICGDIDGDNTVSIFDVIYFIYYKYKSGPPPASMLTTDINRDGYYNILDVVDILKFLYKDGPSLVCP